MSIPREVYLPDPLIQWPWQRTLNPYYAEIKPRSDIWMRRFGAVDSESQRAFDLYDFPLLCGLGYPLLSKVACNLMSFMFLCDEFTNKVDSSGTRAYARIVMDALRNPHTERPRGEPKLGEAARQFSLQAIRVANMSSWNRFVAAFSEYLDAVIKESTDPAAGLTHSSSEYLELRTRRLTIGGYPSFLCLELGLDIPDEVMEHSGIKSLLALVAETVLLTDDMYSYNVKQAMGDYHNILPVVMNERGVDLDGALHWVATTFEHILSQFQEQHHALPSWGPAVDSEVHQLVERMCLWIRGHDCWSFESQRYFGTEGIEIQRLRMMPLFSKASEPDVTPVVA